MQDLLNIPVYWSWPCNKDKWCCSDTRLAYQYSDCKKSKGNNLSKSHTCRFLLVKWKEMINLLGFFFVSAPRFKEKNSLTFFDQFFFCTPVIYTQLMATHCLLLATGEEPARFKQNLNKVGDHLVTTCSLFQPLVI